MHDSCAATRQGALRYQRDPIGWSTASETAEACMTTLFVITDGVRPDAWKAAGCSNHAELVRTGSATMSARCVLPSRTLPNITSMLYGVDPSVHGVHDNTRDGLTDLRDMPDLPSLLQVLAAGQRRSAMFYGWAPLRWLDPTDTLDHDGFGRSRRPKNRSVDRRVGRKVHQDGAARFRTCPLCRRRRCRS